VNNIQETGLSIGEWRRALYKMTCLMAAKRALASASAFFIAKL
jgi:hypothetical protein